MMLSNQLSLKKVDPEYLNSRSINLEMFASLSGV